MSKNKTLVKIIIASVAFVVLSAVAIIFREQLFTQVGLNEGQEGAEAGNSNNAESQLAEGFVFDGELREYHVRDVQIRDQFNINASFEANGIERQYQCYEVRDPATVNVSIDVPLAPEGHEVEFYKEQLLADAYAISAVRSDGGILVQFSDNSFMQCDPSES